MMNAGNGRGKQSNRFSLNYIRIDAIQFPATVHCLLLPFSLLCPPSIPLHVPLQSSGTRGRDREVVVSLVLFTWAVDSSDSRIKKTRQAERKTERQIAIPPNMQKTKGGIRTKGKIFLLSFYRKLCRESLHFHISPPTLSLQHAVSLLFSSLLNAVSAVVPPRTPWTPTAPSRSSRPVLSLSSGREHRPSKKTKTKRKDLQPSRRLWGQQQPDVSQLQFGDARGGPTIVPTSHRQQILGIDQADLSFHYSSSSSVRVPPQRQIPRPHRLPLLPPASGCCWGGPRPLSSRPGPPRPEVASDEQSAVSFLSQA
mmetsp:Transcript_41799/g.82528  ORF Transcript_41799/g.82528 Transcript_41799/m.82528 type:complete len:311 (-) Transcript_41799:711-1643(-)